MIHTNIFIDKPDLPSTFRRSMPSHSFGCILAILLISLFVESAESASISRFQEYPNELATQVTRSMPLWSPSMLPELTWFLGDRFDDRPALIFPPLKTPDFSDSNPSVLTVFNANLWLLPYPFANGHGQRLYDAIAMIDRLNPDIVALQEVWLYTHIEPLRTSLPEYWMVLCPIDLFNRSGLVVFSRHQPSRATFGTFGRTWLHNPVEHLASKGYLGISFDSPTAFDFVCTHAYAPKGKHERAITESQLLHLINLIASSTRTMVLAGDFNTPLARMQELVPKTFAWESNLETRTQTRVGGKKIDYVIGRPDEKSALTIDSLVIMEPIVSDHLPIIATVTFTIP